MELKIIKREVDKIKGCVYAIKHNVTGRIYVGKTCDFRNRVKTHISYLKSGKHPVEKMQEDFDRYGENFSFYLLFDGETSAEYLMAVEAAFMLSIKTTDKNIGYNYKEFDRHITIEDYSAIDPRVEETAQSEVIKKFGKHLEKMRKSTGITTANMARQIGVTPSSVLSWERGRTKPSWENYQKYRDICKKSPRGLWIEPSITPY